MKIIPAILPQRYRQVEEAIEAIADAVGTVQIDFVDGHFATNKTWWFNEKDPEVLEEFEREERGLPKWQDINYELDLMVRDPLQHMDKFLMLGPSKLIFHVETLDVAKTIAYIEALPEIIRSTVSFGIAIGIYTDPETIRPYLPYITSIQCMGIASIGYQGQPFDPRAIEQVAALKSLYPDKIISVDGAVDEENIVSLVQAGATEFVVGSAIFGNNDPRGTIKLLQKLCSTATPTTSESLS
jgi:ribulose-phosphate 3-epimerase